MTKSSLSKKRVTLTDVAKHANVSRSTVSLVIRNNPRISAQTHQRVLDSIDALGYVYHRAAASMRSQTSQTMGLLMTNIHNPFFAQLTSGIEARLEQANYTLLLSDSSGQANKQDRQVRAMLEHWIDGILLCPAHNTPSTFFEKIHSQNIPVVMVVHYIPRIKADYVGANNVDGAYQAVTHFVKLGHQRIAFLGGPPYSSSRKERLEGYKQALRAHNLPYDPNLVLTSPPDRRSGYQAFEQLTKEGVSLPTAILCYNDVIAFGVMLAIQANGLRVGQDIAVVGFDNIEEAELWTPSLTTVSISPRQMGVEAANLMLERINNPEQAVQKLILPTELVVRESCGRLDTSKQIKSIQ